MRDRLGRLFIVLFILTAFWLGVSGADPLPRGGVFVKDKQIFFRKDGKTIQLTKEGDNRAPVLSPAAKNVVYIKKSKTMVTVDESEHQKHADEIWVVNLKEMKPRLLVKNISNAPGNAPGKSIFKACSDKMAFSPDGRKVYFLAVAWTTSCAVNETNIDGNGERFVTDGSTLRVVMSGEYKGHLVVEKHKYFVGGGSYDFAWLVTPDGKEIGPAGEDEKSVNWDIVDPEE